MNKSIYLSLLSLLCASNFSFSQEITGIATYKSFVKLDMKMDSTQVSTEMLDQIKQMLKEQTQKEYELQFSKDESLFKEKEKLAKPGNTMFANATVTSSGGFGVIYQNLKEKQEIRQSDILGKLFLVIDSIKPSEWVLQKETKNIGEYVCFKATQTYTVENRETGEEIEKEMIAWYTPQIPMPIGPMGHGGLPGLILEVKSGDVIYLCNQIILNPKKGVIIALPSIGKKVSLEEFNKIKEQKLQESNNQRDFKGNKTIEIKIGG